MKLSKLGYIGLGKMGKNMVLQLLKKGYDIVAWNRSPEPRTEVAAAGAKTVATVRDLVKALPTPRVIWLMLPAGEVTHQMVLELVEQLNPGDTIIDGSNNFYKNTIEHGKLLAQKKIKFYDAGISGGPAGALNGACVMAGGSDMPTPEIKQLFTDIAAPEAYSFFPGVGAGHFTKMVHNGIEYGMMQAIAEGFAVLKAAPYQLDLLEITKLYNHGSVIESRLIGWLGSAYAKQGPELPETSGTVKHSGEGQWTVETAKEYQIPTPVINESLNFRIQSETKPSYTGQVVSALRHEFGGHNVKQ